MKMIRKFLRWLYRDSDTGEFLSKEEFAKRDPKTTQREALRDEGDTL